MNNEQEPKKKIIRRKPNPNKIIYTDLSECPDCLRRMSIRTLKYYHKCANNFISSESEEGTQETTINNIYEQTPTKPPINNIYEQTPTKPPIINNIYDNLFNDITKPANPPKINNRFKTLKNYQFNFI